MALVSIVQKGFPVLRPVSSSEPHWRGQGWEGGSKGEVRGVRAVHEVLLADFLPMESREG